MDLFLSEPRAISLTPLTFSFLDTRLGDRFALGRNVLEPGFQYGTDNGLATAQSFADDAQSYMSSVSGGGTFAFGQDYDQYDNAGSFYSASGGGIFDQHYTHNVSPQRNSYLEQLDD